MMSLHLFVTKRAKPRLFATACSTTSEAMADKNLPDRLAEANSNIVAVLADIQSEIETLKEKDDRMLAMESRMKETADKADTVIKLNLRGREYHVLKETLLKYSTRNPISSVSCRAAPGCLTITVKYWYPLVIVWY